MIVLLILGVQWVESVSLTCHCVLTKFYREHSICASSQISINLTKCFTEDYFICTMIRQELPMKALLVVSSARNTDHSYKVPIHCAYRFQKYFFISDNEKHEWPMATMFLFNRDEIRKSCRGPSMDASCKIWPNSFREEIFINRPTRKKNCL